MIARIAVVDDNSDIAGVLCAIVEDDGYLALPIHSPSNAIESLRDYRPDLVVLDLHLDTPDGGWRLLQHIRGDSKLALVPIIVCSGDDRAIAARRVELRRYGYRVVPKPFDLDELLTAVQASLIEGPEVPVA